MGAVFCCTQKDTLFLHERKMLEKACTVMARKINKHSTEASKSTAEK